MPRRLDRLQDKDPYAAEKRSFTNLKDRIGKLRYNIDAISNEAKARGLDDRLTEAIQQSGALPGVAQVIEDIFYRPGNAGKETLKTSLTLLMLKIEETEMAYKQLKKMTENGGNG